MIKAAVPREVSDAFAALAPNPEFKKVLAWFRKSLDDTREESDFLEGIELTRAQGCSITLNKILKTANGAE